MHLRNAVFTAGAAAVVFAATAALAHHGWGWAEEEQTELTGTIRTVTIAPPHPALEVETTSDGLWKIELGNPRQTQRAGFVEGSAKPGDEVVVLGNRSLDGNEKRMKAVRITVNGKVFDIYPDRIRTN
ncbi:DUF6152 family protein [Rhizobium sp. GN54]|uniref:DUF6152 family protein n=1 Tax=Rhizobium sp. GN54 TaxID=2898150 RepID=UPI001E341B31|nr:DUF6152 family protein [Rhizobium sp. GN54]MCD2180838.1 DUF6152 family protein [Rhizobium sp. GN54]